MYARMSIYEIDRDRVEDTVARFRDAIETISYMEGLRDAFFLVSGDGERAVALTLWQTHDAMTASRVTASRLRSEAVRDVEGSIVSVDEFDVALHEQGRSDGP